MKIVAIAGTYRKEHIIDQAVMASIEAAKAKGAETEIIYLIDKHIEFCNNCRACTQEAGLQRKTCVHEHEDDMGEILNKIDEADGLIFASPVNFFGITAVMKRFIERTIVYVYWPWGQGIPKPRRKELNKQAVIITASAAPEFMAKLLMRYPKKVLKEASKLMGARSVRHIHYGLVAQGSDQQLNEKQISKAEAAGKVLAATI